MSEANPKRKFWQFHLSTALWVLLAAGILLFLNCSAELLNRGPHGEEYGYGWPVTFSFCIFGGGDDGPVEWELNRYSSILADVVCFGLILATIAVCSEYLIRRREARKT